MTKSVVLVGAMGAGKTTVGRLLAAELGLPFVDTDAVVEAEAGLPVAGVIGRLGEAEFRRREAAAVARACDGPPAVVATGGGAVLDPESRSRMRRAGRVVWLSAPAATLASRCRDLPGRPLLDPSDPVGGMAALLADRAVWYRLAADVVVDATGAPAAVAARVSAALADGLAAADPPRIVVRAGGGAYAVRVDGGLLARAAGIIRDELAGRGEPPPSGFLLVTSETVAARFPGGLGAGWGRAHRRLVLPDGEGAKTIACLTRIWEEAVAAGLDRDGVIVAVGGGAVIDVAGFAAATYLRGVRWAAVPTTLLAQVDASVGGKTAVNLGGGKNLAGAVHQPAAVLCDVDVAAALPESLLRAGLAEAIKHGAALDAGYFRWLEAALPAVGGRDRDALAHLVRESVRIKAAVVEVDEREAGPRALLNFGHTFAHAVEAASGPGAVAHGEAVAAGMVAAARVSARLGLCPPEAAARVEGALTAVRLPVRVPVGTMGGGGRAAAAAAVAEAMRRDKKARGGRVRLVLLERIGRAALTADCPDIALREAIADMLEEAG